MFRPNISETVNDINERNSVFTIYHLLKGTPASVHIDYGDKRANIDGYIEFLDEERRPRGKMAVQVKTYNSRSDNSEPKYRIPAYLIGYAANQPCDMVFLLVADNERDRVFWKYIDKEFCESVSSKREQTSVTYRFNDDEILTVENACETVSRWKRLYEEKAESMFDMYREAEIVMQSSVLPLLDVVDGIHGIKDSYIPRKECGLVLEWLGKETGKDDASVLVLSGDAGTGKTVVLKKVLQEMMAEGVPCLAIKADRLHSERGGNKGLCDVERYMRVLDCLISRYGKAVVIIDQIDALSQYLSNDRAAINAMMDMVSLGEKYGGKLKTVVSCRNYDMRFDASLRSLNKYDHIGISRLDISEVKNSLRRMNYPYVDDLQETTLHVLTVPQNLDVFGRIVGSVSDPDAVIRVVDLYDRLFITTLQRAEIRHLPAGEVESLMFKIALRMQESETLHPMWHASGRDVVNVEFLCSEGLVFYDGKNVSFFHQSFYDYVLARYFMLKGMSVSDILHDRHQGLFLRSTVKLWLEYMRAHDRRTYNSELRVILSSPKIRVHLKTLVLSMLLSEDSLSPYESRLLVSFKDSCLPLYIYVLDNAKGESAFDTVYDSVRQYVPLLTIDSELFPPVWTWIRNNVNVAPEAVVRMIDSVEDRKCQERFQRIAFLKLKDFSSPVVQESCDRYLQKQGRDLMVLGNALDSSPEYVLRHAVSIIRECMCEAGHAAVISDVCEDLLFPLCQKFPEMSYGPVKSLFVDILMMQCFSYGGHFSHSSVTTIMNDETAEGFEENIISMLVRSRDADFVHHEVRSFMQTRVLTGMQVAMRVIEGAEADVNAIIMEIMEDRCLLDALLDTYETEYYFLMSLRRWYASSDGKRKSYYIAYATGYQPGFDYKTKGRSMRRNHFRLLSVIPEIERTPEVRKLYAEYFRRSGGDVRYEKPVRCKCHVSATTAVASKEVCMRFTDSQWVHSFLYAKESAYRKGRINTFSVYSHAEMFRECVKLQPEKRQDLVFSLFGEVQVDVRYRLAGLFGLLEGGMSPIKVSPFIEQLVTPEYLDSDYHRVFDILGLCAGVEDDLFEIIENTLLGRALSVREHAAVASSEDEAFRKLNDVLNSERGRALRTYVSYCADAGRRQRVYRTLHAVVPLLGHDMRVAMLYILWDSDYYDPEQYESLMEDCISVFAPEYVIVLRHAFNSLWCMNHSGVSSYFTLALECRMCHNVMAQIMFWGMEYKAVKKESASMLERLIEGGDEDVICVLLRLSFANLEDPEYGAVSESLIRRFSKDSRSEVVASYMCGTRKLSPERVVLWREVSDGMAFHDAHNLDCLLTFLNKVSRKYPYEAFECLKPHARSLNDELSFLKKDYFTLLLTIYSRFKEDNDLTAMDEIMDVIDEYTLSDTDFSEDMVEMSGSF